MNPYRVVDPTDVLWKRSGAWLIDAVGATVVTVFAFLLLTALFGTGSAAVLTVVVTLAYWLAISVGLQGSRGYTPGKFLCGLRVVDGDGRLCERPAALRRSLLWVVDGFPYVLPAVAFSSAMTSRQNQRVGDRVAGTYVVDVQYVGSPPVAVAVPTDPASGLAPYRLEHSAAYLPPDMDILEMKRLRDDARTTQPAATAVPVPALPPIAATGGELVAGPAHVMPQPLGLSAAPAGGDAWEPRWDPERQAYVRWNPITAEWALFDENQRQWVRV